MIILMIAGEQEILYLVGSRGIITSSCADWQNRSGGVEKEGLLRRHLDWKIFPCPDRLWRAPEIEYMVESHPGQADDYSIADPILA